VGKPPLTPDDDMNGTRTFRSRFNQLVDILLIESSVKLVARTAADVADLYEGTGVFLGDPRMARRTGLSERTVQTAWGVLRDLGMAIRVEASHYDAARRRRTADEYDLAIPAGWRSYPVLGPAEARFRCLHCEKAFNPRAHSNLSAKDGRVTFSVPEFCFCAKPRSAGGKPAAASCCELWLKARRAKKDPDWWALFRQARGDDWPAPSLTAVA
jgi:hypothetical protein